MDKAYKIQERKIEYREVSPRDAEALLLHVRTVGGETDFLSFGKDSFNISIEREARFINRFITSGRDYMIVALDGDKIVGNASLEGNKIERYKHRSTLSITVLKDYWGVGIGAELMKQLIDFARVREIKVISLEVRCDNERAIGLYKRFGFEEIGRYKAFFKVNNEHFDAYLMNLYL